MEFTVEEMNLMCIYDTTSRAALVGEMRESLPHVDEPEVAEVMERALGKLAGMTDADFDALELFSAEEIPEETEV